TGGEGKKGFSWDGLPSIKSFDAQYREKMLNTIQADGYLCNLVRHPPWTIVCNEKDVPSSIPSVPGTLPELEKTLQEVSLTQWLPSVLCEDEREDVHGDGPRDNLVGTKSGGCREHVLAALETAPPVHGTLLDQNSVGQLTVGIHSNEVPWVKSTLACMERASKQGTSILVTDCMTLQAFLSNQRAFLQLRPALTALTNLRARTLGTGARASTLGPLPSPLQALLDLLQPPRVPSMHLIHPRPGSRQSGEVVAFMVEIDPGETSWNMLSTSSTATGDHPDPSDLLHDRGSARTSSLRQEAAGAGQGLGVGATNPQQSKCELVVTVDGEDAPSWILTGGKGSASRAFSPTYLPQCSCRLTQGRSDGTSCRSGSPGGPGGYGGYGGFVTDAAAPDSADFDRWELAARGGAHRVCAGPSTRHHMEAEVRCCPSDSTLGRAQDHECPRESSVAHTGPVEFFHTG
ncbi:unnamed protein product, partial [Discosporangium mesarthrocarpum]